MLAGAHDDRRFGRAAFPERHHQAEQMQDEQNGDDTVADLNVHRDL